MNMKIFLGIVLLLLAMVSCRKEATSWSTDWVVPLINDTLDLRNLTNDSTLSIQNNFYQVELKRTLAQIRPEDYLNFPDTTIHEKFTIPLGTLSLPGGTSFVTNNEDHIFDLDEVLLKKARLKSGVIQLTVENPINTTSFFDIELPSASLNGQILVQQIKVPPKSKSTIKIDVSGYNLDLRGSTGISFNALPSKLKVYTDPQGGITTISNQDTTKFTIQLKDLKVDYALGYFGQFVANDAYDFNIPFFKDNISGLIDLPAMRLEFILSNGIKATGKALISGISNTNTSTGQSVQLTSNEIANPFVIQNATGSWTTLKAFEKTLTFDENNSNIEAFVENLGDRTSIAYELQLNPYGNITGGWDEFFPSSELDLIVKMSLPLKIGFSDFTLKDTFDFKLAQNLDKTHISAGTLHLKLENSFPIAGNLSLRFLDESGQALAVFDDLKTIPSGIFGSPTSFGLTASKVQLDLPFTAELLGKLDQIKSIVAEVKLNTPNSTTGANVMVAIPEKAFLWIKAQSSFELEQIFGQ